MNIARIKYFLDNEIWRDEDGSKSLSLPVRWLRDGLKTLYLAVRYFLEREHANYATSLSFSTILAIVPVAAIIFAVARGFGLDAFIEQWLHKSLAGQPQAAEYIIQLASSYLEHTRSGIIIGIGLLFMLYSVLSLIYNIEQAFDEIWQVHDNRSAVRIITDYTALLFLMPLSIIVVSGFNIFVYTIADQLQAFIVLGSVARFFIKLLPFVMMSGVFTMIYVFMPNTKVKFSKAIIPGTIAGIAMLLLQFVYIHSQIFLTSYNAIYGSLAALPLFMLWIMISWYICLFCAELCYMNQNMEYYAFLVDTDNISHEQQMMMSLLLMRLVCRRFADGKTPYTALELKRKTGIPIRITTDLLNWLCAARLVTENIGLDNDKEPTFQPALSLDKITIGKIVEVLESRPHKRRKHMKLYTGEIISEELKKQVYGIRRQYLADLNDINILDNGDSRKAD